LMTITDKRAPGCRSWPVLQVWLFLVLGSGCAERLTPVQRRTMVRQYRYVERMSLRDVFARERNTLRFLTSCISTPSDSHPPMDGNHAGKGVPQFGFGCSCVLFLLQRLWIDFRLLVKCRMSCVQVHISNCGKC
jgi:hypothetical protein